MIQSIAITNPSSETLTLPFDETMPNTGIVITNVSGLGPVAATVNTESIAGLDGSMYTGAYQRTRNIVFTLRLVETDDLTIEDCRLKVYQYFPVKGLVKIIVDTDARSVYTVGCVESVEPDIFSSRESVQVSVVCPEPYWYGSGVRTRDYVATYDSDYEQTSFTSDNAWADSKTNSTGKYYFLYYESDDDGEYAQVAGGDTKLSYTHSNTLATSCNYVFSFKAKNAGTRYSYYDSSYSKTTVTVTVAGIELFSGVLDTETKTYSRTFSLDTSVSSAEIAFTFGSDGIIYDDEGVADYGCVNIYAVSLKHTITRPRASTWLLTNSGEASCGLTVTLTNFNEDRDVYSGVYAVDAPFAIRCTHADGTVTVMNLSSIMPVAYDEPFEIVLVSTDKEKSVTYYSLDDTGERVDNGISLISNLEDIQTWISLQPGNNTLRICFSDDDGASVFDGSMFDSLTFLVEWDSPFYGV